MSTLTIPSLEELYDRFFVSELLKNGRCPPDDRGWLEAFAGVCRSQSTFILSEFKADEDLVERAGDVVVYREGRFTSVRELVDACASHNWNGTIYEAWVWETAQRVHALMRRLDAISGRALRLYAEHLDYYEVDTGAMQEAIYEARLARGEVDC
ncbi:MAG: hypothetical protein JSR66_09585 [Proteobacteria bacterium]|nr:hypothetical protein [Pseudomonadota bacterium]